MIDKIKATLAFIGPLVLFVALAYFSYHYRAHPLPRYKAGDCIVSNSKKERWEKKDGYEIIRIMEVGNESYRYCWPLINTEAYCNNVNNDNLIVPSLQFSILDNTTSKLESCPSYAK